MADKHAPFVRHDQYGEGGWAPQPFLEKLRLATMALTLLPMRMLSALFVVVSYYLIIRIATAIPNDVLVRKIAAATGKICSRLCLFCLGFIWIKWTVVGRGRDGETRQQQQQRQYYVALVSNHVGWADILVHMSRYFPAFVAREGTQNLPFIGLISRRMGCLYVDREKRANGTSSGVSAAVKQRMLDAAAHPELALRPLLLFPEGTTSSGTHLLPFKTGAFLAGLPVLPVVLRYKGVRQGARVSPAWESISAPRHLLLVMCEPWHSLEAYQLPAYSPSQEEVDNPRLFADNVRQYMLKYSSLAASEATLEDKRLYQVDMKARHGLAAAAGPPPPPPPAAGSDKAAATGDKAGKAGKAGGAADTAAAAEEAAAERRGWQVAAALALLPAGAWWGALLLGLRAVASLLL